MLCVLTVLEKKGETKLYHTYGSTYVRKLQTETAHLTLPITYFSLRAKCWLRGGVGGQFYRYVLWSILIYSVRIKRKVTPWTFIWKGDKQTIKLLRVCQHFLEQKYKSLFEFWCAEFTCDSMLVLKLELALLLTLTLKLINGNFTVHQNRCLC